VEPLDQSTKLDSHHPTIAPAHPTTTTGRYEKATIPRQKTNPRWKPRRCKKRKLPETTLQPRWKPRHATSHELRYDATTKNATSPSNATTTRHDATTRNDGIRTTSPATTTHPTAEVPATSSEHHAISSGEKPIHEGTSWSPHLRLRPDDRRPRKGSKDHRYAHRASNPPDQAVPSILRGSADES